MAQVRLLPLLKPVCSAALLGCVLITSLQLRYWQNSITLYQHTLDVTTNNFVIHNNLGYTLMQSGKLDEAIYHFQEAARIKPDYAEALYQLGIGTEAKNRWKEAALYYAKAAQLRPRWMEVRKRYAVALAKSGKSTEAIGQYEELLKEWPDADIHFALGALLAEARQTNEAIEHYRKALQLAPDAPAVLNNLAWVLATNPNDQIRNGLEAVQLAERACELTKRKQPLCIGTLAAAYAEAGRFQDAIKAGSEAAELATAAGDQDLAVTNRRLVELYKAGQRYHESGETPVK
jgi:Flp pilus assembly protein TadD